jgi:prephenate dehydrogenase (NADP+)
MDEFTVPINVDPNVTPDTPEHAQPSIGLIGMGAMGRMYAKFLSQAGWKKCVFSSWRSFSI